MKDPYRETGTIFRRSPFHSPEGESFTLPVRREIAAQARQLQGTLARAKREGGRFTQGAAGKKRTTLPGGVIVETWINPFGLVPTIMARVTYPGGEVVEEEFWCESGLLTWNVFGTEYPLDVYVGDRLKTLPHPRTTNNHYDSHYWLAKRPDIEYPDYANDFYVDTNYWPSFWTGKARLMMQGLHAHARHPINIFTNQISPYTQGIWMVAPCKYFVVDITADGVFVVKLVLPDGANPKAIEARDILLSGVAPETEKTVAEACYMAALERSGDPVEILSATDMEPLLIESGSTAVRAMAYGWKYARNKLEASIVTFREECMPEFVDPPYSICIGKFVTSLFTISATYSIAEAMWTASVEHVHGPVECRPRTGVTSIYVPQYGSNHLWTMSGKVPDPVYGLSATCCYNTFDGNIQAQYCWYDKNDILQVVWYLQYQDIIESIDTADRYGHTDSPSFSWSGRIGDEGIRKGGFYVGPECPVNFDDFTDEYSTYKDEAYSVTVASGSLSFVDEDAPSTSMVNYYNGTATSSAGGALNQWVGDHFYEIKHVNLFSDPGTQTEHYQYQNTVASPRLWSLVIAPYDAEAAYILTRGASVVTGPLMAADWSGSTYPGGGSVWGGTTKYDFYHIDPYGEFWRSDTLIVSRYHGCESYMYGSWYGSMLNILGPSSSYLQEAEAGSEITTPASYKVYSPNEPIELPVTGYWPTLFPESVLEGTYIDQQPVRALFSYTGDGLYFTEEGSPADTGGYPVGAPGIQAFFIGGA